jgi:exodeoxyribonuclease-5
MWNRLSIGTKPDVSALLRADQIITYKNDTRWYVVDLLRKAKGMPQGEPAMGDRLVMLRNSDLGVNGEQVEVSCAIRSRMPASEKWSEFDYFTVGFSDGRSTDVPASMFEDRAGEAEGLRLSYKTGMTALTFADAITCHKAQGSEWDSVLVVDEGYMSAQSPGWHYTAITRAREYAGIVSVDHLPTAWTRHEAAVFRDEWWESIWDSDLSHTVKVTALAIVEAVEDEDTIRVRADTEHIGGLIDRSVSTVNTHMTKLRKAGCLKGKGSLTMLHFSGGLKPPSTLKQLHALMARQALADEPETRAHVS